MRDAMREAMGAAMCGAMEAAMDETQTLKLSDAVENLLEECRMVLPGVQALFGFQLIAVFNSAFGELLSVFEQRLHLLSLASVAIAGALVMTPAAYHRQTSPYQVSSQLVRLGGRLLLGSMVALTIGIGLDFYLIARVVLGHELTAAFASIALMLVFVGCWFVVPQIGRARLRSREAGNLERGRR
jgi:hypothetical protein